MSVTRLLLFVLFLFGLFHIYLVASRDPGLGDALVAAEVADDVGFARISTGAQHTCGVGRSGGVWCWGHGEAGQLGHGRFSSSGTPVPVVGLPGRAMDIAVGIATSCAILDNGQLWCWGSSVSGQIGLPPTVPATAHPRRIAQLDAVHAVAIGHSHICATERDGGLYCWGDKRVIRGGKMYLEQHTTPQAIPDAPLLQAISAGDTHTCGTSFDGQVLCWGGTDSGALGHSATHTRRVLDTPTSMGLATAARLVASGSAHSCALDDADMLSCWGLPSAYGRTSAPNTDPSTPQTLLSAPGGLGLAAGWDASCVLDAQGEAFCLGAGQDGQWAPFPENVPPLSALSAQGRRICGLDAQGGAWCAALIPEVNALEVARHRPANWQANNSLSARWHRTAGWWAQRDIASAYAAP